MNKNTKVEGRKKKSTGARGTVNRHLVTKCWCRRIETNRARRLPFFPCIFKRNFIGRTFGGIEMAYLKDDDGNESPVKSDGNTSDSAHSTSYQARTT